MKQLADLINYFAARIVFDGPEMELMREQFNQLLRFDPHRTSYRRESLLSKLDRKPPSPPIDLEIAAAEPALMSAYAMAYTAVADINGSTGMGRAFDELLAEQDFDAALIRKLIVTRKKNRCTLRGDSRANISG